MGLAAHPSYDKILSTLRSDSVEVSTASVSKVSHILRTPRQPLFLDLGCCVGQDIRLLAHAHVPGYRLVGADLEASFVELGYDLFRDREKLGAQFLFGDIFTLLDNRDSASSSTAESHPFHSIIGCINIMWCSAFLHL